MLKLYDYLESGNGYKVRLLLHQLEIPFERVELDITRGADAHARVPRERTATAGSRRSSSTTAPRSRSRTRSSSTSRRERRSCPRAGSSARRCSSGCSSSSTATSPTSPSCASGVTRAWRTSAPRRSRSAARAATTHSRVMEDHLHHRDFFAAGRYTIADIALYAYTHVAHEGGFDLAPPSGRVPRGSRACAASRATSRSRRVESPREVARRRASWGADRRTGRRAVARAQGHRVTLYERLAEPGPVGAGIILQPSGMAGSRSSGCSRRCWRAVLRSRPALRDPSQRTIFDLRYRDLGEGWFGLGSPPRSAFETLFEAVRACSGITLKTGVRIDSRDQLGGHELVVVCDGATRSYAMARRSLRDRFAIRGVHFGSRRTTPSSASTESSTRWCTARAGSWASCPPAGRPWNDGEGVAVLEHPRRPRRRFRSGDFAEPEVRGARRTRPTPVPVLEQIRDASEQLVLRLSRRGDAAGHERNTVYLGDCAHATSPQLGQGCNLALCDARQRAVSLARHQAVSRRWPTTRDRAARTSAGISSPRAG